MTGAFYRLVAHARNSSPRGAANSLVTTTCATAGWAMICVIAMMYSFRWSYLLMLIRPSNLAAMQP